MGLLQLVFDGLISALSALMDWVASFNICPAPSLLNQYLLPVLSQSNIATQLINDFIPLGTLAVIGAVWIGAIPWAVLIRFVLHKLGVL